MKKHYLMIFLTFLLVFTMSSVFAEDLTATADLSKTIGTIRGDFYGANQVEYLSNATNRYSVDSNNDGTTDTLSNWTWHRVMYEDSGMKVGRLDLTLQSRYSNTSDVSGVNFTGDFNRTIEVIKYMNSIGGKVIVIIDYMPTWLADNSSGQCKNLAYCPASNYTKWNNIITHAVNNITVGGLYTNVIFEVWNEPDYGSFWMGNLANDNPNRFYNYSILYNNTYNTIKSINTNYLVGGFASTDAQIYNNFTNGFLSNFSNKMDFFSMHIYAEDIGNYLTSRTNYVLGRCATYNANCSRIIWTEWNNNNATLLNGTQEGLGAKVSNGFINLLNLAPQNISQLVFTWSSQYYYGQYADNYPRRYNMVSEPLLNNTVYPLFNITKLFATNHKAGNTVYNSSTSRADLKMVVSKDASKYYITLTNTNSSAVNVTGYISYGNNPQGWYLTDVESGENYTIYGNGTTEKIQLDGYEVKTLKTMDYNISVNFGQTIGIVRGDFYGVDDHYLFANQYRMISVDGDSTDETKSNTTWHRQAMLDAGLKSVRVVHDMSDYTNLSTGAVNYTGNATSMINAITWYATNNFTIHLRLYMMPLGIANRSDNCNTNNYSCTPLNYTLWNMDVLDYINRSTSGGLYNSSVSLEVWNEPYGAELLANLPTDDIRKAIAYGKIFNSTYWAVKAVYPNMEVLGPSGYYPRVNNTITFLSNFSSLITTMDMHVYDTPNNFDTLTRDVFANCTLYNAPCNHVLWSEWNTGDITVKNTTSRRNENNQLNAHSYTDALNSYPANITLLLYSWSDKRPYQNSSDYPQLWSMVVEPALNSTWLGNQTYFSAYNITKLFAHSYAPALSTIRNGTSGYSAIKIVADTVGTTENIILTNTENKEQYFNLGVSGQSGNTLIDLDGNLYDTSDGVAEGVHMDPYEVKVLTEPIITQDGGFTVYSNYQGDELLRVEAEESGKSCNSIIDAFGEFGTYLAIIALALVLSVALGVMAIAGKVDFQVIVYGGLALAIGAIALILGITMQNYFCQLP